MNELIKRHLPDLDYIMKKPEARQYKIITVDLTLAKTDQPHTIYGNFLSVNVLGTEANKYLKVRINSKNNDLITLVEGRVIEATIHKIFITNNDYASGTAELIIGIGVKVG